MIFVTVGNSRQGFVRLLDAIDQLAGSGAWGRERVLMQIGHVASYAPRHCDWHTFLEPAAFQQQLQEADVVVTHAGVGTLREAIRLGKTPVVMPRRQGCNEIVDDHQLELTAALAARGLVVAAYEPDSLIGAVQSARGRMAAGAGHQFPMVGMVALAIQELLHSRRGSPEVR